MEGPLRDRLQPSSKEFVTTKRYIIKLVGPASKGARISGRILRQLLAATIDGAVESMRLRIEGRSTARGGVPSWLQRATDFEVLGTEAGSTDILIEMPTLAEADPERFGQAEMFLRVKPLDSAIDCLKESLSDALNGKADSDLFDAPMISTFAQFGDLLSEGFDAITFGGDGAVCVDAAGVARIGDLRRRIPDDRRVIVAGRLNQIRHSDRMFTLILDDGTEIRGLAGTEEISADRLAGLFGRPAMVKGFAKFRPSGAILRIDAERVDPAVGDTAVWSVVPKALESSFDLRSFRRPQGPAFGLPAIIDRWPGDETDDEVRSAFEKVL